MDVVFGKEGNCGVGILFIAKITALSQHALHPRMLKIMPLSSKILSPTIFLNERRSIV